MKLSWIPRFFFVVNLITGVSLLIALSSAYISPADMIIPSIAGIAFLQLLIINIIFFFVWLFFNRTYAIYSAIFLIFGFTELPNHFQLNIPSKGNGEEVKVLSLNVRNFDLYNWTENKKTRDRIFHLIRSQKANIVCLQEFFNTTDPDHDFKTLDTIMELDNRYKSHVEYTATVKNTEHWGIATFTNYPVIGQGVINFEEGSNNICIYTDVSIGYQNVRIYNMHLASLGFGQDDYTYLESVVERNENPNVQGSKSVLKKMKLAYEKRSNQVDLVREHMDKSPYPIILCGDFNDTPASYAYSQLVKGLQDSFKRKGNGFGATYNGKLPYLRIDYVFTDPTFEIVNHEVLRGDISDHHPIRTEFIIPDN